MFFLFLENPKHAAKETTKFSCTSISSDNNNVFYYPRSPPFTSIQIYLITWKKKKKRIKNSIKENWCH